MRMSALLFLINDLNDLNDSNVLNFPLDDFPKIRSWIERVKAQPGFIPMS